MLMLRENCMLPVKIKVQVIYNCLAILVDRHNFLIVGTN